MSFETIDQVLSELDFEDYRLKFHDQQISDDIMDIILNDNSHISLLSDAVPVVGHRIGIIDKYKKIKAKEIAALFMVAYPVRPKVRKVSQIDSVKECITVIDPKDNIDEFANKQKTVHPAVLCKGELSTLELTELFVTLENRAIKADTFLAAVDLAYKSFYVFNYEFLGSCNGFWNFLDYAVIDMSQKYPVSPTVLEISSFVNSN